MKRILGILVVSCVVSAVLAQEEAKPQYWKISGMTGLNANATGMVNWAAGGNNNVAGTAYGKFKLKYDKTVSWETNLDVEYGLTYIDQEFDKLQKSSDHLKFDTKLGWAFKDKWYLTVSGAFQTQFDLGRTYSGLGDKNPVISAALAPSYTDVSVGIDWKPNSIFSVYLSPVSGRITTAYVSDKLNERFSDIYPVGVEGENDLRTTLQEKYGVWRYDKVMNEVGAYEKKYKNARAELGLTVKGSVDYAYKDLKILSTLNLFTPYVWDKTALYSEEGSSDVYTEESAKKAGKSMDDMVFVGYRDNNRRIGNFDIDWTFAISYKFLKCLSVTMSTDLKYYNGVKIADKNGVLAERVQTKLMFGLGVGYTF